MVRSGFGGPYKCENNIFAEKRELVFKEDGQGWPIPRQSLLYELGSLTINVIPEYAQVVKMLGNGRLEASCFDGERRLAHIRGKMRKKVWINQGDMYVGFPCH